MTVIDDVLTATMMIAVLAFGLSYFTSNAIAGQIGNHLLEQSMQTGPEDGAISCGSSMVTWSAEKP